MGDWLAHITVKPITKELLPDVRWLAKRLRNRDDMELKATDTHLETFAVDVDYEITSPTWTASRYCCSASAAV